MIYALCRLGYFAIRHQDSLFMRPASGVRAVDREAGKPRARLSQYAGKDCYPLHALPTDASTPKMCSAVGTTVQKIAIPQGSR